MVRTTWRCGTGARSVSSSQRLQRASRLAWQLPHAPPERPAEPEDQARRRLRHRGPPALTASRVAQRLERLHARAERQPRRQRAADLRAPHQVPERHVTRVDEVTEARARGKRQARRERHPVGAADHHRREAGEVAIDGEVAGQERREPRAGSVREAHAAAPCPGDVGQDGPRGTPGRAQAPRRCAVQPIGQLEGTWTVPRLRGDLRRRRHASAERRSHDGHADPPRPAHPHAPTASSCGTTSPAAARKRSVVSPS